MCVKATLLVRQPWLQRCLDRNRTSGGEISIEANKAFFMAESTVKRKVFWISFLAGADEPETASCRPRQISPSFAAGLNRYDGRKGRSVRKASRSLVTVLLLPFHLP
jgi:hypothetical protein